MKNDTDTIIAPTSNVMMSKLLEALPGLSNLHATTTETYDLLTTVASTAVIGMFAPGGDGRQAFGPFGEITFPYRSMGAVDSLDLFGLDELIIFSFYWANRARYRKVADIGANIGLHSLILSRCGFEVHSYEPDPRHITMLNETLQLNEAKKVTVIAAAVSDKPGSAEFVRVLGNTTGSHLAGAKGQPYGETDRFTVPLVSISEIIEWADFMKIDAEGHETNIILATTAEQWETTDAMLEIGTSDNARAIFEHCTELGIKIFTQKTGWQCAARLDDLPTSYKEGSAFLTRQSVMPGMHSK